MPNKKIGYFSNLSQKPIFCTLSSKAKFSFNFIIFRIILKLLANYFNFFKLILENQHKKELLDNENKILFSNRTILLKAIKKAQLTNLHINKINDATRTKYYKKLRSRHKKRFKKVRRASLIAYKIKTSKYSRLHNHPKAIYQHNAIAKNWLVLYPHFKSTESDKLPSITLARKLSSPTKRRLSF